MNTRSANLNSRQASVLIIVMWVAFGLVSITLYFAHAMLMDLKAADNRVATMEANQAIEGGALYVSNVLANRVNPMIFPSVGLFKAEAVKVGDAKFWIIGRDTNQLQTSLQATTPFWGLIDEASKLNLNGQTTSSNFLSLPNMTVNTAAAMLDWESTNTTPSTDGAKSETYSILNPPYLSKNAPYETIDELRMVYGLNLDNLYGEDANLNGAVDPNENDGMKLPPSDNQDGNLDSGLFEYVTTWTHEALVCTNGTNRVVVTETNGLGNIFESNNIAMPNLGGATPTSVLQLYYLCHNSGLADSDFQKVEPYLLNNEGGTNLININTAGLTMLSLIPGIGSNLAPQVLAYRQENPSPTPTVIWLAQALNNSATAIAQAGPYITAYSYQFTADIVAVGHNNRGFRRVQFVFDCSGGTPLIVYRQDLTYLGWPLGKKLHDDLLAQNTK
jgi:DNA uptake protein ComE-like DNA-binding protein